MATMPKLDRETTVYGLALHSSGQCYAFNREYLVLPRQPSPDEVEAIRQDPDVTWQGRAHGHGRFRPTVGDERQWVTYWRKLPMRRQWVNIDYDKAFYEEMPLQAAS